MLYYTEALYLPLSILLVKRKAAWTENSAMYHFVMAVDIVKYHKAAGTYDILCDDIAVLLCVDPKDTYNNPSLPLAWTWVEIMWCFFKGLS